jgi:uncharacterized protein YodC (DUF2158 family)
MKFKVGDQVELLSGGPVMTVESLDGSGGVWCVWFNSYMDVRKVSFIEGTLKKAGGGPK